MPGEYSRKPNTTCKVCGSSIYRRPSEISRGNVFCSVKCHGIFCRIEKHCVVCGKTILTGENKKTCSRACANINRKGIKYIGRRVKDKVSNYKFLKIRLVSARGSRCERCSYSVEEILQVHHVNRDKKDNSLSNLELLCPNCHFEEHYLKSK